MPRVLQQSLARAAALVAPRLLTLILVVAVNLFWPLLRGTEGAEVQMADPSAVFATASQAFQQGKYDDAIRGFQQAAAGFEQAGDVPAFITTLGNLSLALQAVGYYRVACATLDRAMNRARSIGDEKLASQLCGIRGSIGTFSRKSPGSDRYLWTTTDSEQLLSSGIEEARSSGDSATLASLLHDEGVLWAGRAQALEVYERAQGAANSAAPETRASKAFTETLELCDRLDLPELRTKTLANRAMMHLNLALQNFDLMQVRDPNDFYRDTFKIRYENCLQEALKAMEEAGGTLQRVADSYPKSLIANTLGDCYRVLVERNAANRERSSAEAVQYYQKAIAAAREAGHPLALSNALGSLGKLYEEHRRYEEALALSREAWSLAQKVPQPDLIFRWAWQTGRILRAAGHAEDARKAYEVARETLIPIRHDVAIGYGNRNLGYSFREAIGAFYFELAELRLEEHGASEPPQEILQEARELVESIKSAELEDYFQDECINVARQKLKKVDTALKDDPGRSAVLYVIPLSRGTAILLTIGERIHFARSRVSGQELQRLALRMRDLVVNPETHFDYRIPAQTLYEALVAPVRELLDANGITNLIFVPDGALRTIPMAALFDGRKFLVESYAIGITPGLTLMEPRKMDSEASQLLVGALSVARHGFSSLANVEEEVERIRTYAKSSRILMDRDFLKSNLQKELAGNPFSIVHIASHGQFQRESGESFFLTYDGKLTLNELEAMIRPKEYDSHPVELLCLSACETALGDDRAALGLAGIAIKSGARSALATLWEVEDESTGELMANFFAELFKGKSRAEALRSAQLAMLRQPKFDHPHFWAPFMIIGNWY